MSANDLFPIPPHLMAGTLTHKTTKSTTLPPPHPTHRTPAELATFVCNSRISDPSGPFAKAFTPREYHGWTEADKQQLRHDLKKYFHTSGLQIGKPNIRLISTFDYYTKRGLCVG